MSLQHGLFDLVVSDSACRRNIISYTIAKIRNFCSEYLVVLYIEILLRDKGVVYMCIADGYYFIYLFFIHPINTFFYVSFFFFFF